MGDAFIRRHGGGTGASLFAAIGVKYPAGYVVTCSMDDTVLTAGNTNGEWIFPINKPGTWTVKCEYGANVPITKNVVVSKKHQSALLNMSFDVIEEYLIKDGNTAVDWLHSAPWGSTLDGTEFVATGNGKSRTDYVSYPELLDLTGFKSLTIEYTANYMAEEQRNALRLAIGDTVAWRGEKNVELFGNNGIRAITTLDVSLGVGTKNLFFVLCQSEGMRLKVHNLWLTREVTA